MFLVLQIGQIPKLLFNSSHSSHIGICPQTQNKTLGGIDKHIMHSSDLNDLSVVILVIYSSSSSSSSSGGYSKASYPSPKTEVCLSQMTRVNGLLNIILQPLSI